MIEVKVMTSAAFRSRSKRKNFSCPYKAGMTAREILEEEFDEDNIKSVITLVNNGYASKDYVLKDKDRVTILTAMGGG